METLSCVPDQEYLFVTALAGSRPEWRRGLERLELEVVERRGAFDGVPGSGRMRVALAWPGPHYASLFAVLGVVGTVAGSRAEEHVAELQLPVCLAAGESEELDFRLDAATGVLEATLASGARSVRSSIPSRAYERLRLTAGMLPAGSSVSAESIAGFPAWFLSLDVGA